MNRKERILAPSSGLVAQLQADIRDDERLITSTEQALVRLRAQGDPYVAAIEAKLEEIRQIQQGRQALLRKLVQTRAAADEAIERTEG